MSDYVIHNGTLMSAELYHYGVKGMKWGVRRAKKYKAKADMYRSFAKDYDPDDYIGSKPLTAKERSKMNQKVSENLAKAKKYDDKAARAEKGSTHNKDYKAKQRKQDRAFYGKGGEKRINEKLNEGYGLRGARHLEAERKQRNEKIKKTAKKGAKAAASALTTAGLLYMQDQVFYGGIGTKAAKAAVKHIGRVAVSAYVYARGGRDIRWYDN